ncbi:MAG: DUF6242 domain-containing protein [Bacteroidales bacterium]|nr:DUF6242 domain-containing protein [Bacteroidales bacterium]
MMRKKNSLLILSVIISGLFVSCWDNFTERAYYSANITSFVFDKHDTCPNIENYVFCIDNLSSDTGLIYNVDSLPYGSFVKSLYPTLKLQSSNGKIYMNDSVWAEGDSLDFTSPVIFRNTSSDGLYTRVYKITVNVHQVEPDSMNMNQRSNAFPAEAAVNKMIKLVNGDFLNFYPLSPAGMAVVSSTGGLTWSAPVVTNILESVNISSLCVFNSKYYITSRSGQLYTSGDGTLWTATSIGTNIVTLYGQIKDKDLRETTTYLIGLAKNVSGDFCFARSTNGNTWELGPAIKNDPLLIDFPITDYASVKSKQVTGVEFYTIGTGLNSEGDFSSGVWWTETGLNWKPLYDDNNTRYALEKRKGASLFFYDNYLVCFGGIDPGGFFHKELRVSKNKGITWIDAPANWAFLNMNAGLAYADVYVERQEDVVSDVDREFIWIFGGIGPDHVPSPVVWRGYLNKMVFERR